MFYCPQKPYLTWGTLREQVTFPLKPTSGVEGEDQLIIRYLKLMRLKPLLDRIGGLDVAVSWNL